MEKIIEVRFVGDNSVEEKEKVTYIRYLNRILFKLKEDIISNRGYVKIISKKGFANNITFFSDNNDLNKQVSLKLFNAPAFQH